MLQVGDTWMVLLRKSAQALTIKGCHCSNESAGKTKAATGDEEKLAVHRHWHLHGRQGRQK